MGSWCPWVSRDLSSREASWRDGCRGLSCLRGPLLQPQGPGGGGPPPREPRTTPLLGGSCPGGRWVAGCAVSRVDMLCRAARPALTSRIPPEASRGAGEKSGHPAEGVWRGLAGEPGLSGQGPREGNVEFSRVSREVEGLVQEAAEERREELVGACGRSRTALWFPPRQGTPSPSQT